MEEQDKRDWIGSVMWRWDEQVKMLREEAESRGGCLDSRATYIIERMYVAFVEGCRDAYALGKHNPETAELIDRRYRMFMKNDIEHARLQVAARAMQGVLASRALDHGYIGEVADMAVKATDALLERLAGKEVSDG